MKELPQNDHWNTIVAAYWKVHASVAIDVETHANQEVTLTGQRDELEVHAVRASVAPPSQSLHKNAIPGLVEVKVRSALVDIGEQPLEADEDLGQDQN